MITFWTGCQLFMLIAGGTATGLTVYQHVIVPVFNTIAGMIDLVKAQTA